MAANIKTACTNKYNAGVAAGNYTVTKIGSFNFNDVVGKPFTKTQAFTFSTSYVTAHALLNNVYIDDSRSGNASGTAGSSASVRVAINGNTVTVTFSGSNGTDGRVKNNATGDVYIAYK